MKLISLNTWGGKILGPLSDFLDQQQAGTDIFCLQEVYRTAEQNPVAIKDTKVNLFNKLKEILVGFQSFFAPGIFGYNLDGKTFMKVNFDLQFGLAIFIKDTIEVLEHRIFPILNTEYSREINDNINFPVNLQKVIIKVGNKLYSIYNIHGVPGPGSKLDTEQRIKQSMIVRDLLRLDNNEKILVGDFNLLPETRSVKMLEESLDNLISRFGISKTRSKLSPWFGKPDFQGFADFSFVSKGIEVISFEVPDLEISDHLPMILYF